MAVSIERKTIPDVPTTYDAPRYTAPASMDASVNEIRCVNKTGTDATVDVELYPLGNSSNNIILLPTTTVPANSILVFKGFRVLLESDELQIKADTSSAIDVQISVLEMDTASSIIYQGYVQDVSNGSYDTLFTATTEIAVNDLTLVNKTGSAVTVDLDLWPLGVSGNAITLVPGVTIDANGMFEYIGVINLLDTDVLKVQTDATSAVDAILSGVE